MKPLLCVDTLYNWNPQYMIYSTMLIQGLTHAPYEDCKNKWHLGKYMSKVLGFIHKECPFTDSLLILRKLFDQS